ncbi:MAG: response regulator [Anaerolineae bacterium]
MPEKWIFLLVSEEEESLWPSVLRRALAPLGELQVLSEEKALQAVSARPVPMVILDAAGVRDVASLTSRLKKQRPDLHVVVATASPTWRRARNALQAGASDYIGKSLEEEKLRAQIEAVLKLPPPRAFNAQE